MVDNGGNRELMDCGSKVKHRNRNVPEQTLRNGSARAAQLRLG